MPMKTAYMITLSYYCFDWAFAVISLAQYKPLTTIRLHYTYVWCVVFFSLFTRFQNAFLILFFFKKKRSMEKTNRVCVQNNFPFPLSIYSKRWKSFFLYICRLSHGLLSLSNFSLDIFDARINPIENYICGDSAMKEGGEEW